MRLKAVLGGGAVAVVLSLGALAGVATAASGTPCGGSAVFAALGDNAHYVQMNAVGGTPNAAANGSITLSGSSSAVFKGSCVAFLLPQVRFYAMNAGGAASTLRVSVQYKDSANVSHDDTIGTLSSGYATMRPSPALTFGGSQVNGNVQVTLTPSGAGAKWILGGVYVDPFKRV